MDRKKQAFLGLAILIVLIIVIVAVTTLKNNKDGISDSNLKQVFVATGGGKENFLADEEVNNIMKQKYGLKVTYDSWSNGKIVKDPLLRKDGSKYDAMFCSDQRFYDYFKVSADTSKGEAQRDRILEGGLTLNTPIVIYSWDTVVDALIKENIVTQKDNVYYITDMNKLISYILEGKKWSDIGVDMLYGTINIDSTDPVTSSPGATYYGLLLSIMCGGTVTEENLQAILQEEDKVGESIKEFIKESQLKVVGCMDECRIYEQGASAWFFQGIVMIAVEMGAVAIADKLKRWLEEREEFKEYAKVGTLDSKRLRKNLAYILDDNKVYKYDIIKCNRLDDEEYIVEMRNKYNTYELICNENGDIKDKSITIK